MYIVKTNKNCFGTTIHTWIISSSCHDDIDHHYLDTAGTVVAITKSKLIQLRSAIGVSAKLGVEPERSTVLTVDRLIDRTGPNILQPARSNNKRLTKLLQVVVFLQQPTRVKPACLLLDRPLAGTSFSRMSCVSNVFKS